jgi:hypothetical protein
MTPYEKALEVYWREMPSPYEISTEDRTAAIRHITAYLAALPHAGEVGELVKEARIAELEREHKAELLRIHND